MWLYSDYITLPPDLHNTTPRGSPGPTISPVGQREPNGDIQLLQHCGSLPGRPTHVCPMRIKMGICKAWTGDQIVLQKGNGAYSNQYSDLGRQSITQAEILNSGFPYLYSKDGSLVWLQNRACSSPWFGTPNMEPVLLHCPGRETDSCANWWVQTSALLNQKT